MATWAIVPDYTAPSGKHVFCLTDTKNENQTFNLAIADTPKSQRISSCRLKSKLVPGKMDQGGGPIWRCKDENNYYVCRINPLENNYRIYQRKRRRSGNNFSQLTWKQSPENGTFSKSPVTAIPNELLPERQRDVERRRHVPSLTPEQLVCGPRRMP